MCGGQRGRRSHSAPTRRNIRKVGHQTSRDQACRPGMSRNPGISNQMWQRATISGGAGSSGWNDAHPWSTEWESAEEWNRWHMQYAAAWMHPLYQMPAQVHPVASPTPNYGGRRERRNEIDRTRSQNRKPRGMIACRKR